MTIMVPANRRSANTMGASRPSLLAELGVYEHKAREGQEIYTTVQRPVYRVEDATEAYDQDVVECAVEDELLVENIDDCARSLRLAVQA